MTDLNWALAHMESKSKRRIAEGAVDLVREAKPKGERDYVSIRDIAPRLDPTESCSQDDLDGIELLLFDESKLELGLHRIFKR